MGQIYGVLGVSRGQPPKGITAAVALQFLMSKNKNVIVQQLLNIMI